MRTYVNVYAAFDTDGRIYPKMIIWKDGRRFPVDRVLDVQHKSCLRSGGSGLRYHISVGGQERYLYLYETRWFVESSD